MLIAFILFGLLLFIPGFLFYNLAPVAIGVSLAVLLPIYLLGLRDLLQTRHAIRKNFPIIGNLRYLFEKIRPEIQQYFVEDNVNGRPISRNVRSVVYQRSKKVLQTQPYGTQRDLYEEGKEWAVHSMFPIQVPSGWERFQIGGKDCTQPYSSSRLNISAMSYGSLSWKATEALNLGAKQGGFSHNTGEGGIAKFHLTGADIVWQIGTGYFGCRTKDGHFCRDEYTKKVKMPEVKMVELKLSQGAKPGKGGMLPGEKVTPEIAKIRGVEVGKSVLSPASHSAFSDAPGLVDFIKELRDLAEGKPIGIKLCVGSLQEFRELAGTMKEKNCFPDFIAVDGSEGGTGAAPVEFSDAMGTPLKDGLSFVNGCLKSMGIRNEIALIASGKSFTGFDMVRNFALGADVINSARGMMLALGCIQALQCHSNHCPVGIATNNPHLVGGLDIQSKALRVANYHSETLHAVKDLLGAMGKKSPQEIGLEDIYRRGPNLSVQSLKEVYPS